MLDLVVNSHVLESLKFMAERMEERGVLKREREGGTQVASKNDSVLLMTWIARS